MKAIKNIKCFAFLLVLLTIITPSIQVQSLAKNLDEPNTLTIVSENTEREEVLGFEYQVLTKEGEVVEVVNLEDVNEKEVKLEDGEYIIRNTKTPKGYDEELDVEVKIPQAVEGGFTRSIRLYPKHIKTKTTTAPKPVNPNTRDSGILSPVSVMGISALGIIVIKKRKSGGVRPD